MKNYIIAIILVCLYLYFLVFASIKYQRQYRIKKTVAQVQKNEQILNTLDPLWSALRKDINNMELPGHYSHPYFKKETLVYPIVKNTEEGLHRDIVSHLDYSCQKQPILTASIWVDIFSSIKYFEYAELAKVDIELVEKNIYSVDLYMDALGKSKDDEFVAIYIEFSLKIKVKSEDLLKASVVTWQNTKVNIHKNKQLLFHDDTNNVFSSSKTIARANESIQEKRSTFGVLNSAKMSICDINNDGWDDLYITSHGKSMFLQNNHGVLQNVSSEIGLDTEGSSCSLFVDIDNDGDKDVVIGNYKKHSQLYINNNGKFNLDKNTQFPNFVTSISAADYNNDGLIDLYFSTFFSMRNPEKFFSKQEIEKYKSIKHKSKVQENKGLARNLLFKNTGLGYFKPVKNSIVNSYTPTFQGAWSDFDQDNDVDLFIANDFGRDFLFRNNDGTFEDASCLIGSSESFSMGISWGDYNNDQKMDMYISGMYSKAGTRLTKRLLPMGLHSKFFEFAQGNFLFEQQHNKFRLHKNVRGLWSWGSQFGDFDNDGYLDIYTADGYYTAPKHVRRSRDL